MSSKLSRRDFLKVVKRLGTAAAAIFGAAYYTREFEPSWLEVSQVDLPLVGLPRAFDGFRILQITDIHIGGWMDKARLEHVIEQVVAQSPDLIVFTGDYVIGHSWSLDLDFAAGDFAEVIAPLAAQFKTLAVMGNHDHWTDVNFVRQMLDVSGVPELKNDVYQLEKDGDILYVAGLDDITEYKHKMEDVEAKLPAGAPAILLAHEPDYADVSAVTGRFFLQLSGHSHGGQVVIPFVGPPVLPHGARKYPAGLYQVGDMYLYTCRGVGMTSPFVRFNCRPEITVFTLNGVE